MEMVIASQEDVKKFFEQMPETLRENPALSSLSYRVEEMVRDFGFRHNGPLEVSISEDGKSARVKDKGSHGEDHRGRYVQTTVVDYTVADNGNVEMIETHGTQYDARTYKPSEKEQIPYGTTVIMDKSYQRTLFDKEGIELAYGYFGMDGWALANETFGNIEEFHKQLLAKGEHMPAQWTDSGPVLPRHCQDATVSGVTRSPDNPAFATVYSKQVDKSFSYPGYTRNDVYLGEVHSEWPDKLRVDHYELFAKYEGGRLQLLEGTYDRDFPGQPLQEIVKNVALRYERALEGSETKRHRSSQYETLKARLEQANAKYKPQPEIAPTEPTMGEPEGPSHHI